VQNLVSLAKDGENGSDVEQLNFKRLGKIRVIIFENIFAIVVPVDLSSYVFGNRCIAVSPRGPPWLSTLT
jgi:hypothetical protein